MGTSSMTDLPTNSFLSAAHDGARPWSREDRIGLCVLLAVLLAGLLALVHPWYDPMSDASIYISSTRALLAGEGYSYLGTPFHLRPPGFPWLLAPVLAAADTHYYLLNLYVSLFGCGAVVLLYCWVRPALGWLLSLLVCIVTAANPLFLQLCNQVMSDIPGLFAVMAALLVARSAEQRPSLKWELLLGVMIGAAAYVRVLGIVLLPAVLLFRVVQRLRTSRNNEAGELAADTQNDEPPFGQFLIKRCAPLIAVTVIVFAPWIVRNQLTANPPPADQLLNYSYSSAMFHYNFGDPRAPYVSVSDFGLRVLERTNQITAAVATRLADDRPTPLRSFAAMAVFGLYLYWLVVSPSIAGFFILLALGLAGSYFAFQDRLLLPVAVLLLPQLVAALRRILSRFIAASQATMVVAALLVLLFVADFSPRKGWDEIEATHVRLQNLVRELVVELPADAKLATIRGFHLTMLMEQPVYSLRWAYRLALGMEGVDAVVDRYGVNTVLLDPEVNLDAKSEALFVEHYGAGMQIGGVRIIRVRE